MGWQVVNLRQLYSGGNGDLFVGQRSDTHENVVVKFLRDFHLEGARRYFAREVRILRRGFSGVVPLLHADLDGPRPYYVMPYLPGGALTRWAGKLNEGQLRGVARAVAGTLARLHAAGIAHGDVKPDNILLSQDGQLQLADPLGNGWGCTVIFAVNRGGTPGYWAPEVAGGGSISKPGDVYSYGATLYHLATGHRPEDGRRLTLDEHSYVAPAEVREAIAVCCQANAQARPGMPDVLRILRGELWADIQAMRTKGVLGALIAAGLVAVLLGSSSASGRGPS